MSSTHLPPLLHPYLHPPALSLTLLTSVLGATSNWLILRFLHAALNSTSGALDTGDDAPVHETRLVLVSFLRDWEFWRTEGRRGGVDIAKGVRNGTVCFVDGLTGLLSGQTSGAVEEKSRVVLMDTQLEDVGREVLKAVKMLQEGGRVLLVIDGLDALMAITGAQVGDMRDLVAELREVRMILSPNTENDLRGMRLMSVVKHVHAAVLAVAADFPLVQARNTPLEIEHAALVMGMTHQAQSVMSLRGLETGAARDVSGVLRVSRGGEGEGTEEGEWLYLVGGDGGVKIFERGA